MSRLRACGAVAALLCWLLSAGAVAALMPGGDPAVEARLQGLSQELRCLVCQNQSIADSNAPLAEDLRREIRQMIARKMTDREIVDFMTQRYGDFVLYRPPFKGTTALLWVGPFVLLAVAGAIALRIVRRRRTLQEDSAALSPDERTRLRALLDEIGRAHV